MPFLVNAYLEWKSAPQHAKPANTDSLPADVVPLPEEPETTSSIEEEDDTESSLPSDVSSGEGDFVMQCVDTFGKLILPP